MITEKEDFERKNRLEAEAPGQQIRELTIELEQLVRQRRRMAIIKEETQRRQRSKTNQLSHTWYEYNIPFSLKYKSQLTSITVEAPTHDHLLSRPNTTS